MCSLVQLQSAFVGAHPVTLWLNTYSAVLLRTSYTLYSKLV